MKTMCRFLLSLLILGVVTDMPIPEGFKAVVGDSYHVIE
jgi:hypothetical protein